MVDLEYRRADQRRYASAHFRQLDCDGRGARIDPPLVEYPNAAWLEALIRKGANSARLQTEEVSSADRYKRSSKRT